MPQPVIRANDITRNLKLGSHFVHALRGVNLEILPKEMVGIIGPSGSGKSTLLGIIGGLDSPTDGRIEIDGVDITRMSENQLTDIRNRKIGFIFQFFNLIPTLTALENVALPIEFAQVPRHKPNRRAMELLDMLGLGDRFHHRPNELSGGQQQRVAIARALANDPPILLADEPTGNLDTVSGDTVMEALNRIRAEKGTTVVLVTHDRSLASQMDRVLTLVDGVIVDGAPLP
ncbi:MAG: ABC transporter ATP-binding protein [Chloroflexota bacterium]|nr:ABC transporter ATP-binding protein [Chloroflexota bacterium]MDE2856658.1 ABC transporter ATP-binding protein [Chloroflexota bacterium]MDE2949462.1 ABC transporter ATP-binding protein [Chloroflexota bacterium]